MSDHELFLVGLVVVVFPLVAALSRFVAIDLDGRGLPGWFFGLLVLVTPLVGVPAWLIARQKRPQGIEVQS